MCQPIHIWSNLAFFDVPTWKIDNYSLGDKLFNVSIRPSNTTINDNKRQLQQYCCLLSFIVETIYDSSDFFLIIARIIQKKFQKKFQKNFQKKFRKNFGKNFEKNFRKNFGKNFRKNFGKNFRKMPKGFGK